MVSMLRRALITAGVLLAVGGIGKAFYHEGRGSVQRENPLVASYVDARVEAQNARIALNNLPTREHEGYIPQHKRFDYSVGQAHSKVESAHQRMGLADGTADSLRAEEPAVEAYALERVSRNIGAFSATGGLMLALFGSAIGPFRRS